MEQENSKNNKLSFWQFLNTLRWLFAHYLKLSAPVTILSIVSSIFLGLTGLGNAYIFARLLDKIIKIAAAGSSPNEIIPMLGVLLVYNIFIVGLNYGDSFLKNVMTDLNIFRAPQVLYEHVNSLGIQTLENAATINKLQRTRETLGSLKTDFYRAVDFFSRLITLGVAAFIILKIMPVIAAIIFISIIPGLVSNKIHMRKSWNLYREETENKRRVNWIFSSLTETSNLQEITITSAYGYLNDLYRKFADRYVRAEIEIYKKWQGHGFLFGSLTAMASILGYFFILKNLFGKMISIGDATFQIRALDIFAGSLSTVANNYASLSERCVRINEMREFFETKPIVEDGSLELGNSGTPLSIKFENVSFRYPNSDKYVIKDLDLEIKPGEKIAIVGENGAGKTTLIKLLCRFYKVSKGAIFLDEKAINNIKISSWYKNLGVLFQDYNTYGSLSLKENIYLGRSDEGIDKEWIEMAAGKAHINSFIENYKNGYEQVLSEKFKGGTRPSTGQWQKIAIARFFYRNSPVVVFDEPTASIDAVAESEIFGQIYDFFKDKTVIIISHRFSTVRNADRIYVVNGGEIVESGTHKQLMKLKGKYYNAFNIQAKGYK